MTERSYDVIKILHINVTYRKTSTGSIVWDLTRDDGEVKSRVLFSFGDTDDEVASKYEKKNDSLDRRFKNKVFGRKSRHGKKGTNRLIREILEFEPDIVHIHVIHHGILDYESLFRFLGRYGKPVVYTMHDCWAFTGGCYYYTSFGCSKFIDGCNECMREGFDELDCKKNESHSNWTTKRNLLLSIDRLYVVGVSKWLCGEIKKSYLASKPILCIPNGINTDVFCPDDQDKLVKQNHIVTGNDKYTVLGVCDHWNSRKGLDRFIQLASELDKRRYEIILVGEAPNSIENDIPDMIQFVGRTKSVEELVNWYRRANVFVNMSYEETFGLVTAEAACSGTMVIGFKSTANTELIQRVGGILIEKGDMKGIAENVEYVCTNKIKPSSEKLREIRKYYSKERMVMEYKKLYKKIIEEARS